MVRRAARPTHSRIESSSCCSVHAALVKDARRLFGSIHHAAASRTQDLVQTAEAPAVVLTVPVEEERELVLDILGALGAPAENAAIQAQWLIEGDLRGHPSHGLQRLPVIAERIRGGLSDPAAEPVLVWQTDTALTVDGRRGLGPCVGARAVAAIAERAPQHGVAVAAVQNANHLGLLAPYVERCAERGLIGVALTTSEALVHPWGGRTAQLGTNPIAIAVPSRPQPLVLDMATGSVSMGKVLDYRNRGVPLDPGWAIDSSGNATTDAAAAAQGALAPFGGPKGYALGLAFEVLVASLTGSAFGRDVAGTLDTETVCNKGDLFICLDPCTFNATDFLDRVTAYLETIRGTPPQTGYDAVLVPGDRARIERERRLADGVQVADTVWQSLQTLRADLRSEAVA